jgi:hypothetical protein
MNNYLDVSTYAGMKVFRVLQGADGKFLDSPKYVSFRGNILCGYYATAKLAEVGFLRGDRTETRLEDFEGIDARLRG